MKEPKVLQKVTEFLKKTDRFSKTIVFCVDIEHAECMRQALITENKDIGNEIHKYIMCITRDNAEVKAQLENFIDEDSSINLMREFKQIIGRGTRLLED